MKAKEIRDLIDFISNSDLDEVNIETQEFKIAVKKNSPVVNTVVESTAPVTPVAPPVAQPVVVEAPKPAASAAEAPSNAAPAENNNYVEIKSPMIGTFYGSANPESEAFVKVGDTVKVGQTVCIVEAMKLFNEIESEYSGKVVKILVENASPVEYDQPLFLIDPS